ncbi:WbqC family protein [Pelagibius sp.]|uniref:WbqC family protein n=1 Tax=Pelagibius sp. TaxID=1931238 RepID=UPI003BB1150B
MPERIVAIHQPNFFPWLGYFNKIVRSDAFIFLDHVQFPKKGGNWSNRVKLIDGSGAGWVTAPVARNYHGFRSYREMRFREDSSWREKILRTIEVNYQRAPFFLDNFDFVAGLVLSGECGLAAYNENAVRKISARLGIGEEKFHRSSELPFEGQSNEMLVSLAKSVAADVYMCGGGAGEYQQSEVFEAAGVTLLEQGFRPTRYTQVHGEWVPGLSVIDALLNVGTLGVRRLLGVS